MFANERGVAIESSRRRVAEVNCRHTRLTCQGSNQYQTRVKCIDCQKMLVYIHFAAPEDYVRHALEMYHANQALRIVDLDNGPAGPAVQVAHLPSVPPARAAQSRRACSEPPSSQRVAPVVGSQQSQAGSHSSQRLQQLQQPQQPVAVNVSIQIAGNQQ